MALKHRVNQLFNIIVSGVNAFLFDKTVTKILKKGELFIPKSAKGAEPRLPGHQGMAGMGGHQLCEPTPPKKETLGKGSKLNE